MADVIRIKRRVSPGSAGAPTSLANAELAYNEVDHTLYYGEGTGGAGGTASVIRAIGGDGLGSNVAPQMNGTAAAGTNPAFSRADHIHPSDTSRAPLNSPALTGTPTSTTPTPSTDNSTKIATTAFVQGAIAGVAGVGNIVVSNGLSGGGTGASVTIGITANGIVNASLQQMPAHTYMGNNTASTATPIYVTAAQLLADIGAAPVNNTNLTGVPIAPTAANGTNTTQIATTQYVLATRIDQLQPPTSDVPWNSKRITGLLDPSGAQDAATKNYVDATAQGLDAKASVRLATTTNLASLSGNLTVDGFTTNAGDRILVKDQTTQSANGIYIAAAGAWTRALDADAWTELPSAFVFVEIGSSNADNGFVCTVDAGGTIGTTAVTWVQFSGAGQITAGNGMTKTGNQLDVGGTVGRISVAADSVDIDANYIGQSTITTLGTVAAGTWNATIISVAKGGTGVGTLTGYVKGAGTSPMTASATIPNTDISGLGSMSTQNANLVAITGGTIDGITLDCGTF